VDVDLDFALFPSLSDPLLKEDVGLLASDFVFLDLEFLESRDSFMVERRVRVLGSLGYLEFMEFRFFFFDMALMRSFSNSSLDESPFFLERFSASLGIRPASLDLDLRRRRGGLIFLESLLGISSLDFAFLTIIVLYNSFDLDFLLDLLVLEAGSFFFES